jgi:hypothetical protein
LPQPQISCRLKEKEQQKEGTLQDQLTERGTKVTAESYQHDDEAED